MARVFLSHASPDRPVVRRIATALRAAGHETWLYEEEILVGESIPAAVERGLREAHFVVLCLSKEHNHAGETRPGLIGRAPPRPMSPTWPPLVRDSDMLRLCLQIPSDRPI